MNARLVTSLSNPTVKAVRALHLRKERDETGLFVAEGLKNVTEGVELGHAPSILLYGKDAGASGDRVLACSTGDLAMPNFADAISRFQLGTVSAALAWRETDMTMV